MISIDEGKLEVKGTRIDLMADLTVIMRSMVEQGIADEDSLSLAVAMACMSDDELKKQDRELREAVALASILFGEFK